MRTCYFGDMLLRGHVIVGTFIKTELAWSSMLPNASYQNGCHQKSFYEWTSKYDRVKSASSSAVFLSMTFRSV